MGSNYKLTYNVDMVFCIDCTGSMNGIIDMVKNNALSFYHDVTEAMMAKGKQINQLRTRIIAFRDYRADGENAMMVTDFFDLPEQSADFDGCIQDLVADGGGDDPEDGLEALGYAIKSKWNTEGVKKRQIIVVWTDAPTHDLGYGRTAANYPNGMAKDFSELTAWWGDCQNPGFVGTDSKRLLLYAPDMPGWSYISQNWDNVLHFPSEAGNGLSEVDYQEIINAIVNSI